MNLKNTALFLYIFCIFIFSPCPSYAARVGIYGCVHGDRAMNQRVAESMQSQNVTDVIANGDFSQGNPFDVDHVLNKMSMITGVSKEHFYIMPGNWDEETVGRVRAFSIFDKYGSRIANDYSEKGTIEISGKKIQVAHFPQHPIPKKLLPLSHFLFRHFPGQAHIIQTMAKKAPIPEDVDLNVFGHTHIRGHFFDTNGKLTINAGGLTDRKLPDELRSFAIYDTEKNEVEFYNVETAPATLMEVVSVHIPRESHDERVEIRDFAICGLPESDVARFVKTFHEIEGVLLDLAPDRH